MNRDWMASPQTTNTFSWLNRWGAMWSACFWPSSLWRQGNISTVMGKTAGLSWRREQQNTGKHGWRSDRRMGIVTPIFLSWRIPTTQGRAPPSNTHEITVWAFATLETRSDLGRACGTRSWGRVVKLAAILSPVTIPQAIARCKLQFAPEASRCLNLSKVAKSNSSA